MMCFSDFPAPEHFPNYMHNSRILEYFRMYADKFNLLQYVQYKTAVCSIQRGPDFGSSGQWMVTTEKEGKQDTSVYDGVLICTGHHSIPNLPLSSFAGVDEFRGEILHSRQYKTPDHYKGKRVVVIGIGNSGGDIAVELSRTADKVFLSTRRGAWVTHRVADNGFPRDIANLSRFSSFLRKTLPSSVTNHIVESALNKRFNHGNYGLLPQHRFSGQHPTINDDLPNRIISGFVQIRPNVRAFTGSGAIFEDGTEERNIDVVIFATGYCVSFPFCDPSLLSVSSNKVSLYKYMFPCHLEVPTLAVIGLIQPLGAIMPISELQCRLATRVFKGLVRLPNKQEMAIDVATKKFLMNHRYVASQRHTIQVDYVDYMDQVATLLGVKPDLLRLFTTDPWLALQVVFGPCTPYQFRLMGPGRWSGARDAILSQWDRIILPTQTRKPPRREAATPLLIIAAAVLLLFAIFVFHF